MDREKDTVDSLIVEVSKKIKEYRMVHGLSQIEFALGAKVSTPVISEIENCNTGNISLKKLIDICHYIGYSVELSLKPIKSK